MSSQTRKVGVAVVGCGKAGSAHLHAYAACPGARVLAVWDVADEQTAAAARRFNVRAAASLEEIGSMPEVELVSLCGPSATRADQSEVLAAAGKHLLCEKPIASSLAEAQRILDAAARAGVRVFTCFNMRFHPVVDAVTGALAELGPPHSAAFRYTQSRPAITWRHRLTEGGGVLKEQGIHVLDLLRLWLGEIASVHAETAVVRPGREVEDVGWLLLRFSSGSLGGIYASYEHAGPEELAGTLAGAGGTLELRLSPYEPARNAVTLHTPGKAPRSLALRPSEPDAIYPGLCDATRRLIDHVVGAVQSGGPSAVTGEAGRDVLELILDAYRAERRRTAVALGPAAGRGGAIGGTAG